MTQWGANNETFFLLVGITRTRNEGKLESLPGESVHSQQQYQIARVVWSYHALLEPVVTIPGTPD